MDSKVGRRGFVVTSLGTGFALAAQPVSAQTITTDAQGLVAGEIKIGEIPAYRAVPEGTAKVPLVLVVQEIFGVHEHIMDLCRRFAKAGYMAIAPALYARQGDVSKMKDIGEIIGKVVAKVPDEQVMKDLDATIDWAKKSGRLDGDRIGITGFCWGGRITWLYAAHAPLKAGVAWYGPLSNPINALQTHTALDLASKLKGPVLGIYAGDDSHIPVAHVELMKRELATSGGKSGSELVVVPNVPHGFNADYRPSYRKEAAEASWKRMMAWFKAHGL